VVYVPAYNPTVVYGVWAYPAYPPYYWPPPPYYYPGGAFVAGFAWGVGISAGIAIFGGCNWGHSEVNINVNKAATIDRNFDRTKVSGGDRWQHDASHRGGVSYRDNASRDKYAKNVPGADGRRDYRGRDSGPSVADRGPSDRGGPGDRGGVSDRGGPGVSDRAGPSAADRSGGGRDNAFQGVGGGASSQRDVDRGRASNQSLSSSRGSGGAGAGARAPSGGARAGGGGGARGGGGRR
jgi:hypothetical protein